MKNVLTAKTQIPSALAYRSARAEDSATPPRLPANVMRDGPARTASKLIVIPCFLPVQVTVLVLRLLEDVLVVLVGMVVIVVLVCL